MEGVTSFISFDQVISGTETYIVKKEFKFMYGSIQVFSTRNGVYFGKEQKTKSIQSREENLHTLSELVVAY